MIDRELRSDPRVRIALGASVLAALLLVVSVVRAVQVPATLPAPADSASAAARSSGALDRPVVQVDPAAVAEHNIFSPTRTPPAARYLMPNEEFVTEEEAEPAPPEVLPVVLGTAVSVTGGAFATVQLPGTDRSRIVHVGDRIGDFTVTAIVRGRVTFRRPDRTTVDVAASR